MPYIKQSQRLRLQRITKAIEGEHLDNAGEVNYLCTVVVREYLKQRGTSYATINNMIGALECAKLELYRRLASPYEDLKIADNGDIYQERENSNDK